MKYKHLSLEERYSICSLKIGGFSNRQIAEKINRSPSTISRELRRNKTRVRYSHKKHPRYEYLPDSAENIKTGRRQLANARTPLKNEIVKNFVFSKLKQYWSPDIISGVLRKTYGKCTKYNISPECIYQYIYSEEGEKENLKNYLTRKHKRRRKYTGRKTQKLSKVQNQINISERIKFFPKSETRKEFGHFEGDSILSVRTTYSALRTEVERKTRFIFAQKINKKSAEYTEFATLQIFSTFPKNSIKSTTWDNGTEHANHEKVTERTGIKIFFADPYKSWQRGTNEHANGMIRRFFPKGTNFDKISENQIQIVVNYLNNRPRKILNYRTSQELFDEELAKITKRQKSKIKCD